MDLCDLGGSPPTKQSITEVIVRAIYSSVINIIQVLMTEGSVQGLPLKMMVCRGLRFRKQ